MENNIYDLVISELILKGTGSAGGVSTAKLVISSTLGATTVQENFNGPVAFTSSVENMPTGYTVQAASHVINYPGGTPSTSSTGNEEEITGPSITVILGAVGSTYEVTSTVILEKAGEADITLNGSLTITSVLPTYYGVKAFEALPTLTALTEMSSDSTSFTLTSSSEGRLFVAVPTAQAPITSIVTPSGLFIDVDEFTSTVSGSHTIYQLGYDTILTGSNNKTFNINFS